MKIRSNQSLRILGLLAVALIISMCKGDLGSTGPTGSPGEQGAQGPQGPQGPVGQPASIVPIAWGFVSSNGALGAHSPNVTGVVWDVSNSWFNITISGEDYFWTRYATVVTPSTGTATGSLAPAVGSVGGHLLVWLNNTSGGKVQDNFQFVTFR